MKHLFVPYELAVKLQKKGFNEPCFATYNNLSNGIIDLLPKKYGENRMQSLVIAPLYQQVIDWFRENHGIEILPQKGEDIPLYKAWISKETSEGKQRQSVLVNKTYYEAFNQAIEIALKLI